MAASPCCLTEYPSDRLEIYRYHRQLVRLIPGSPSPPRSSSCGISWSPFYSRAWFHLASGSRRGKIVMDPFATPEPSLKHKRSSAALSSKSSPKKPRNQTFTTVSQYMHRFPLPLRVFLLLMGALWCLPVLLVMGMMYVFWQLPRDLIRRRSRVDRGRSTTRPPPPPPSPASTSAPAPASTPAVPTSRRISATPANPPEYLPDLKPKLRRASVETFSSGKRSAVISRDFAHNAPPPKVPLSAIYAQNRVNPSLNSGESRRSSFSTDPVHDLVIMEIICRNCTTSC